MEKDMVHIYNQVLFSHKKNEMMPSAAIRMDLETITLSEVKSDKKANVIWPHLRVEYKYTYFWIKNNTERNGKIILNGVLTSRLGLLQYRSFFYFFESKELEAPWSQNRLAIWSKKPFIFLILLTIASFNLFEVFISWVNTSNKICDGWK